MRKFGVAPSRTWIIDAANREQASPRVGGFKADMPKEVGDQCEDLVLAIRLHKAPVYRYMVLDYATKLIAGTIWEDAFLLGTGDDQEARVWNVDKLIRWWQRHFTKRPGIKVHAFTCRK